MENYQMLIDGAFVDAAGGETFDTINPFDGKTWAKVTKGGQHDVDRAVDAADRAFRKADWSRLTASARGKLLRRLGDLIADNADRLATIEVRDNGKLINEVSAQVRAFPEYFYYFGGLADKIEGSVLPIEKPETFTFTLHEPLGVCAAITAWNSPLLLAVNKLGPGLAAGNTFVIKPSEFTSASTLELCSLFEEAGFPPGVVNVVTGFGAEVGAPLVDHEKIAKVAFTGSEAAGARINQAAAKDFKRSTMELGGKSANIVFDDADLDNALKGAISGIFAATGQTCVAGSRLLIQRSVYDAFLEKLVNFAGQARLGDPMENTTQVGPVTTRPQYDKILEYIDVANGEGARCLLGGGPASGPDIADGSQFIQPTIFRDVRNDMRIAREEVFGPVLACIPFDDEEDALKIANDSPYGLAAGVWTSDVGRMLRMAKMLEVGMIWTNTYRAVSYMAPFGGYKRSGIGRENGIDAIKEYMQTKAVWISTASEVPDPFVIR